MIDSLVGKKGSSKRQLTITVVFLGLQMLTVLLAIDSRETCSNSTDTGESAMDCASSSSAALMPPDVCPKGQEAMTGDEHTDERWR